MKYPESAYINAGHKYEIARTPEAARAAAGSIRTMMEAEHIKDREEARKLVETGRAEARK